MLCTFKKLAFKFLTVVSRRCLSLKGAIKVTEPERYVVFGDRDITSCTGAPHMADSPFAIDELLS